MTQYLKAFYAAALAAIGATSAADVSGHGHIGLVAGLTILGATLTAGFGVAGVTNAPPKTPPAA